MTIPNPYLDEFKRYSPDEWTRQMEDRRQLVCKYAWAIPDQAALDTIARCGPIVEIGAGTGYWAHLLRQMGVDVVAYDLVPPRTERHHNYFHRRREPLEGWPVGRLYTEVCRGGARTAGQHGSRTLFLCWPPYGAPMAAQALTAYMRAGGTRLVYVGESEGGCTANDQFYRLLERDWGLFRRIPIPQWWGMHDYLWVYHMSPYC